MLNLLYCLDQNYNLQTINSIMSFLKNINESINIYIIHENPESFEEYLQKIEKEEKINKIKIKKFNKKSDIDYPNLFDRHVSIATYFRLHLEDYMEEDIDHLIYVDSDVICISNPNNLLHELKNKLIGSKFIVCVKTISKRLEGKFHIEEVNRLGLINDNYFNAGVMIIDFNKWKNQNVSKKLINISSQHIKLGNHVKIKYVKDRPGHDKRYALNSDKINKKLLWKSSTGINKGLKKTFLWYLNNKKY
mgnify:CR=1 FL=1